MGEERRDANSGLAGERAGAMSAPNRAFATRLASEAVVRVVRLASQALGAPLAAVTLEDQYGLWRQGEECFSPQLGVLAPCLQVMELQVPVAISDLSKDRGYPQSVLAGLGAQSYAGVPLVGRTGRVLGVLAVMDDKSRKFECGDFEALADFAGLLVNQLELERDLGRFDPISGLPNAKHLMADLDEDVIGGPRRELFAVLLDLADPRQFGHLLGVLGMSYIEDVLKSALGILRSVVPEHVRIYHVKTMSYLMLIDPAQGDTWQPTVRQCARLLAMPVRCNGIPVSVQSVFGIAPFSYGEVSGRDVIRTALSAAAEARHSELGYAVYNAGSDSANRRRFTLLNDVRSGLDKEGQFSLAFQPRVDVATGACCGAEALLRWNHPELGPVSPGEFIPLVEQTALMVPVTRWVVSRALRQLADWRKAGEDVRVSMNISARNLEDPNFFREFEVALTASGVPPHALELEVTESALIRNRTRVLGQLHRIRALGVELAIDDFGTGYSSFSYLHKLPASILKLDGSFVRTLGENQKDQILVRSMISMAHDMGYRVVGEGVETPEVFRFLADCRCDEVQGYLFAKPLPPDSLVEWMRQRPDRFAQLRLGLVTPMPAA